MIGSSARRVRRGGLAPRALAAAVWLAMAIPLAAVSESGLIVKTPALTWSRHTLRVTVEQSGSLAGRRIAVFVFIDGNMIERYGTDGNRTDIEVTGLDLVPGNHEVMVKAGTAEGRSRFRYLSPILPGVGAIAVLALAAGIARARKRSAQRVD